MFSTVVSGSVELRILEVRHAEIFFDLVQRNRERLLVWCPWLREVATLEKTRAFLAAKIRRFADGNGFTAGFFEGGELIGVIALEYIDAANLTTEIGYWIDGKAEGRGLVTAGCRKLIEYAFGELNLQRIQIRCSTENSRSRAVAEKLGFAVEGVLRHCERLPARTTDLVIYGLLKNEPSRHA